MENELVIDSMGHCFLCLNQVSPQFPPQIKVEFESDTLTRGNSSLERFSRYLKLDTRTIFTAEEFISPQLLAKVEKSKLKVELCEGCGALIDEFSELHRKFEKIEMEVVSILNLVQDKLSLGKETCNTEKLRKLMDLDLNSIANSHCDKSCIGKVGVLKALRKEALQKCSRKLRNDSLRVKVRKLSVSEVNRKCSKLRNTQSISVNRKQNLNCDALSPAEYADINMTDIKREYLFENSPQDDSRSCDSDSWNMNIPDSPDLQNVPFTTAEGQNKAEEISKYSFTVLTPSPLNKEPPDSVRAQGGNYKCSLCSREFINCQTARRHYRSIHLKERYKCTLCGKEFLTVTSYYTHHKSSHMGIRFKCNVCNDAFTTKQTLGKHQLRTGCGNRVAPKFKPM